MNSLHVSLFGNIYFTLIYYGLMGIKFRVDSFFSFIPLNVYIFSLGSYVKLPVNFIVVLLFTINVYFLAISKYPRFCFFSFSSLSMICLGVYLCVYFTQVLLNLQINAFQQICDGLKSIFFQITFLLLSFSCSRISSCFL